MFWFRYVNKNRSAVENNKIDFNVIGNYWERGNLNEIDLVAINELDKKMIIAEIKMNVEKLRENDLIKKSEKLLSKYKGYDVEYLLLGMQTLEEYL
jgi:hypothetical protein